MPTSIHSKACLHSGCLVMCWCGFVSDTIIHIFYWPHCYRANHASFLAVFCLNYIDVLEYPYWPGLTADRVSLWWQRPNNNVWHHADNEPLLTYWTSSCTEIIVCNFANYSKWKWVKSCLVCFTVRNIIYWKVSLIKSALFRYIIWIRDCVPYIYSGS